MRARYLIVIGLLVALGATACGGSSSKSGAPATGTPTSESGGTEATTTTGSSGGSGGSGFCAQARAVASSFKSSDFTRKSATDLKQAYQNFQSNMDHAISVAPSAIKGDLQTLRDAYTPLLKALADANYDYTKLNASSLAGISDLAKPNVLAASQHVAQYFASSCGVTSTT